MSSSLRPKWRKGRGCQPSKWTPLLFCEGPDNLCRDVEEEDGSDERKRQNENDEGITE